MIKEKYNLKCTKGHYHYSPNPDAFVGLSCSKPFVNPVASSGDLKRNAPRCPERLEKLK